MFIFPDSEDKMAKQVSVLEDFETNNRKYRDYLTLEIESNKFVKDCFKELEEKFQENTKQIASLNKEIEKAEINLKNFLAQNGIKVKEIKDFSIFDKNAAQNLVDIKIQKQNQKLMLV